MFNDAMLPEYCAVRILFSIDNNIFDVLSVSALVQVPPMSAGESPLANRALEAVVVRAVAAAAVVVAVGTVDHSLVD